MLEERILAIGIVGIVVVMYPLSKVIAWYLRYRQDQDWLEIQEITKQKGVAVGELAKLLGRSTLSK